MINLIPLRRNRALNVWSIHIPNARSHIQWCACRWTNRIKYQDCGPTRPPSAWPLTDTQMARLRTLQQSWRVRERAPTRGPPRR